MARKPKLFGGAYFYHGKQYRCIVLATSQKQAAEMIGESLSRIRDYYCITGNPIELKVAEGFDTGAWIAPLNSRHSPNDYKKIK